jgi:hypothetical protein
MKKREKKRVTINEDTFVTLGIAINDLRKSLGKKCEYCGCYDGIHRADCILMLNLK